MKIMNRIIIPVTGALLLGACGSNAADSKDNTPHVIKSW